MSTSSATGKVKADQSHPRNDWFHDRRPLTARELEIVKLMIEEGLVSKEIATRLNLSTKTVETHRAHIFRAAGVHSSVDLTCYAIVNEIVDMRILRARFARTAPFSHIDT